MEFSPQRIADKAPLKEPIRILVIDDDCSIGNAIRNILGRWQCESVLVSRAHVGIEVLRQSAFDTVMVDIFMPGMNGLDAIDRIRRSSAIPIIAMSGFRRRSSPHADDYLEMAAQRGATLCMRKPFQPIQLIEAIKWSSGLARQTPRSR